MITSAKIRYFVLTIAIFATLLHHDVVHAQSDAQRLQTLNAKRKASRSGLISFSTSDFRAMAEAASRPYSQILMLSADESMCAPCATLRQELKIVAKEHSQLTGRKAGKHPVFFVEVKLTTSDQEFLADYGVRHVPMLYHVPPGKSRFPRQLKDDSADGLNLQELGFSANVLKHFINARTGSAMHVVRGGYEIPFVQTVRSAMPYIATLVGMLAALAVYTGAYKSPMLWFGVVVLVYIFSVGGGHYSWIHNTPLAVVDKNGAFQYIAGGSRSQYVAEGFFVSFTCVCISGLVILIQELPSVLSSKSAQSAVGMTMVMMVMCAIAALLLVYQSKMPSYLRYNEM